MKINGEWVGWGLGDWSHNPDGTDRDPTVRRIKAYMRAMFRSYAGNLEDSNKFDEPLLAAVKEMQGRLVAKGVLVPGQFHIGVLDLETQIAMGYKKRSTQPQKMTFTVEGHLSDMYVGPCAVVASVLESQGDTVWRPTFYDNRSLPFNNKSGVDELKVRVGTKVFDDGKVFPEGMPWDLIIFSQGAQVGCEFMEKHVIPENGELHWRWDSFRRGLAFGNPNRLLNQCAPWVPDPPEPNTEGIMDWHFDYIAHGLQGRWMEHTRTHDWYGEKRLDEAGMNMTAIAKIICYGDWTHGPASIVARVMDLFTNPFDGLIDIVWAMVRTIQGVARLEAHGTYELGPCIEFMRGTAK